MAKKKDEKTPKKLGRPLRQFDRTELEKLLAIQCTTEEIASVLSTCCETLYNWAKRETEFDSWQSFSEAYRGRGKASLRRMMFKSADGGNFQAQSFLAKNYLGMKDRVEQEVNSRVQVVIDKDDADL